MDKESLSELQTRLVETRKVFPSAIEEMYRLLRIAKLKVMQEKKFEWDKSLDLPEELFQICNDYNKAEHDELPEELIEQTRMMLILAAKKNCEISKITDAI